MSTIRLTIAYQGTDFVGWQRQRNGLSVQQVLEEALHKLTGHPVACRAAGRTDAGVHAMGQVVSFPLGSLGDGTQPTLPLRAFVHGTNFHLPPTIRVLQAELAPADFDARFSASGKMYRYQLWNAPTESPLHRHTHWHLSAPLDVEAMRRAAAVLVGRHDFRAFRAADCERKTTERSVRRFEVLPDRDGTPELRLEVEATAFLKNMVRILAGTLVYVGKGKLSVEDVADLLRSGERARAGPTAPAHGLILCRVDYGPRGGP